MKELIFPKNNDVDFCCLFVLFSLKFVVIWTFCFAGNEESMKV